MMTSLERVVAALQHKEADHVPVYPLINSISRTYCGIDYPTWSKDPDLCAESIIRATEDIGVDVICTLQDLSVEAADFGQKVDYPLNDAAHPSLAKRLIQDIDDYARLTPINPRITPRMSAQIKICDTLVKKKGKDTPIVAFVFGPLGLLSMLRGQSEMFLDCLDDPDAMHVALEVVTETLMEYCKALIETGVHAIMFDTLFASQSIMRKEMWVELEFKYIQRLSDYVHSQGCMVMIHNCGNGIYFDVQIEAMKPEAISFLHPTDDCASLAEVKEKYGSVTTLIGCIEPSWLLSASREDVIAKSKQEIDTMGKGGGFILSTGCEYPSGLAADHAKTIVETARTYGRCK